MKLKIHITRQFVKKSACDLHLAVFLLGLFFKLEAGGNVFL
jgi:hypothetical protein